MVFPFASVPPLTTGARSTRCTPPLHALEAKVVKLPAIIAGVGTNCGAGLLEACPPPHCLPGKKKKFFFSIRAPAVSPELFLLHIFRRKNIFFFSVNHRPGR